LYICNVGHKKLQRFAAIKEFSNVFEGAKEMKGQWHQHFGNNNPIVLELACGKGEYTENRAEQEKDKNFIGIDIKGNRMFIGARNCLNKGLSNAAYLRIPIDSITDYFTAEEVSEIWIIFPDPFLRDKQAKNRLTHQKFLAKYQHIITKDATINLKTDSKPLFDFTLEVIKEAQCVTEICNHNIYEQGEAPYPLSIKTYYEGLHLEDRRIIQYVRFSLPKTAVVVPKKKSKEVAEQTSK
jgi:tRNA (guanine-N7-)-methyltransferase